MQLQPHVQRNLNCGLRYTQTMGQAYESVQTSWFNVKKSMEKIGSLPVLNNDPENWMLVSKLPKWLVIAGVKDFTGEVKKLSSILRVCEVCGEESGHSLWPHLVLTSFQ